MYRKTVFGIIHFDVIQRGIMLRLDIFAEYIHILVIISHITFTYDS